jgi:hypothetical protein
VSVAGPPKGVSKIKLDTRLPNLSELGRCERKKANTLKTIIISVFLDSVSGNIASGSCIRSTVPLNPDIVMGPHAWVMPLKSQMDNE